MFLMTFCNVYIELSNRDNVIFSKKTITRREKDRQRERNDKLAILVKD